MPKAVADHVADAKKFDKGFSSGVSCFKCADIATIFCPVELDDYADVREYFRAAKAGIERAVKAGFTKPAIVLPSAPKFKNGELSSLLGALAGLYVPIQFREAAQGNVNRVSQLFVASTVQSVGKLIDMATSLESALFISRDIGKAKFIIILFSNLISPNDLM